MLHVRIRCLVIAVAQWSVIASFIEVKALTHVEKGVSMNEPSTTRRSFYLLCRLNLVVPGISLGRSALARKGTQPRVFCIFLSRVYSTLDRFLLTEERLYCARACLRWSHVTYPLNLEGLWWCRKWLRWFCTAGSSAHDQDHNICSGSLCAAV